MRQPIRRSRSSRHCGSRPRKPRADDRNSYTTWTDVHALLLAVEVLSPSTARYDRTLKRRYYQRSGVGEYWVVDANSHLVERWRSDDERPEIITESIAWQPAGASDALVIDLVALFTDAPGD